MKTQVFATLRCAAITPLSQSKPKKNVQQVVLKVFFDRVTKTAVAQIAPECFFLILSHIVDVSRDSHISMLRSLLLWSFAEADHRRQ